MSIELKSLLFILSATLLWGIDLVIRYPVTLKMNYVSIVFLETLIGLVFVSPWIVKNRKVFKTLKLSDWLIAIFIGGIGMCVCGYLQTFCIQKATPGLFSFFQIFQPFFVIGMAYYLLKEKVDNLYLFWGSWAVLSALLMFSVDLGIMMDSEIFFFDIMIALLTMLIWGLCTILGKKFLSRHEAGTLVCLRWFFGFIFSSAIMIYDGERVPTEILLQGDVFRFMSMCLIAGPISMFLYYMGLKQIAAGKVSIIELSYGASGMIFSAIYTFEELSFLQLIGATSFFMFIVLFLYRSDNNSLFTRSAPT